MREIGYFEWLCDQVDIYDRPGHRYFILAKKLYDKPFYSILEGDTNREVDGMEFRFGFKDAPVGDCTCLELLVGLASRMTFMADGLVDDKDNTMGNWFFMMLANLGLALMEDEYYLNNMGDFITDERLDIFVNREYEANGLGGLFPLKHPKSDQRKTEIWYQMNDYLMERMSQSE